MPVSSSSSEVPSSIPEDVEAMVVSSLHLPKASASASRRDHSPAKPEADTRGSRMLPGAEPCGQVEVIHEWGRDLQGGGYFNLLRGGSRRVPRDANSRP
jgi:hypothetical protein